MLLAVALSAKEGTQDYNWQLQQYLEAVGIQPQLVLTDADPGVTASIADVFPLARHLWCLWHIHLNLRKNLGRLLDTQFSQFVADFKHVQAHISKAVFDEQWEQLLEAWPQARPYLDEQLTPNTRYWAGYAHDRFSTGAVSTQRGEGLNRHFKKHLSGHAPLSKLLDQVLLKEKREEARLTVSVARDEVNPPPPSPLNDPNPPLCHFPILNMNANGAAGACYTGSNVVQGKLPRHLQRDA